MENVGRQVSGMNIHHGVFASTGDEININLPELAKCGRVCEATHVQGKFAARGHEVF